MLQAISDVIGFKFKLYTVPDQVYGVFDPDTGEWDGIVRQLIDKRADLAVASMTINYARETVIDFTKPFMNLGISILFKAPKDPVTELFRYKYKHPLLRCPMQAPTMYFQLYEPPGAGNMAVHSLCLRFGIHHNLDCGAIFALRMGKS